MYEQKEIGRERDKQKKELTEKDIKINIYMKRKRLPE